MDEKESMYSAHDIACYIVYSEYMNNRRVSNLRLQKLLYFVQLFYCAATGNVCFNDRMEAWQYGPVVPSIYFEYKSFGADNIVPMFDNCHDHISREDCDFIDGILSECAAKTNTDLVNITHNQDPWRDAYNHVGSRVISNEAIQRFVAKRTGRE